MRNLRYIAYFPILTFWARFYGRNGRGRHSIAKLSGESKLNLEFGSLGGLFGSTVYLEITNFSGLKPPSPLLSSCYCTHLLTKCDI